MRIAYVTTFDASDIHAWSGSGAYILRTLQACGLQPTAIGNLSDRCRLTIRLKEALYRRLFSRTYLADRSPQRLRAYAAQASKAIGRTACDVVFSPGTVPVAYLKTDRPVVFWTDATFAGMVGFYPSFRNLCMETVRNGNRMEQMALANCRLALYSSDWAADSAILNYDVDPAKVKVVPFGANVDCTRSCNDIRGILRRKVYDTCKLLFIGVDWHRKGGDKAIAVAEMLTARGLKPELHVVGCTPQACSGTVVKTYGFVSKASKDGRALLDKLMAGSHFLLLPSRAECCAVVLAEASSFGLPSLASRVGGIPTAVRDGKNGQTFPLHADASQYCEYIQQLMASRTSYEGLALSSFHEYSQRLNWSCAGKAVADLLREYCSELPR